VTTILLIPAVLIGCILLIGLIIAGWWILVRLFAFIGAAVAHIFRFIGGEISDILRVLGSVIAGVLFIPLIIANIVIGRWSAAAHYGRAFSAEGRTAGVCLYRIALGHPFRLLGLSRVLEGVEGRLPNAIAQAPTSDKPRRASGMFEGYTIVGSLPGGGSGGKLYIAEPNEMKLAGFDRRGFSDCAQVVIKTFSLTDGSSLPQIVRESRALDAARKMGLVLEHELTDERFYYVMKYVPGESLATVTQRLHAESAPSKGGGLDDARLATGLGYVADLLDALHVYHKGGLWHKDVKPDNIIIDPRDAARPGGKAFLVDFGLVTPLRSAMTLTTHGTEYFRDPELVRMALRGVKVHQIDGAKFDVYAAGAVLYSVIENSFPAHGGLSRVEKRCPDALRWIIRRSMTDYDKRYATARAMLADVEVVLNAEDPFAVKPADLPSVNGKTPIDLDPPAPDPFEREAFAAAAASVSPTPSAPDVQPAAGPNRVNPRRIRVANWWTGQYQVDDDTPVAKGASDRPRQPDPVAAPAPRARVPAGDRLPAAEQLRRARERAHTRRDAARARIAGRAPARRRPASPSGINGGVVVAVILVFSAAGIGFLAAALNSQRSASVALEREVASMEDDALAHLDHQIEEQISGHLDDQLAQLNHASPGTDADDDDVARQLMEAEKSLRSAAADAGAIAQDGLEAAISALESLRLSLGIEPGSPSAPAAAPVVPTAPRSVASPASRNPFAGGPLGTPGARVAFLSDFRPPLDRTLKSQVSSVSALLTGSGADVFGDFVAAESDPAKRGEEIDLVATLRNARGPRDIDDRVALAKIRQVVREREGLDLVIWIAPDPGRESGLRVLISTDEIARAVRAEGLTPGLLARYALPG
jgi:serine/threonine protein kinase